MQNIFAMKKIMSSTKFRKQALMYNYRVTQKNARQLLSIVYQFGWCSQQLVTYLSNHIGKYFRQRLHVYIKQTFQSYQKLSEQHLINFKLEQIFEYLTKQECLSKEIALNLFRKILLDSDFTIDLEDYIKLPEERQKLKNNLNERINEMGINRQRINIYFQAFKQQWIEKKKKIKIIPKSVIIPTPQTEKASFIQLSPIQEKNKQNQRISSALIKTIQKQNRSHNYSNFFIYASSDMKQSAVSFSDWDNEEEVEINMKNPAITYMPIQIKVYSDQSHSSNQQIWNKIETIDLKTEYYYKRGYIITGFQNSGKSVCSFLMSGSSLEIKGTQLQASNGQNLREKKQFQIQLNENTSIPVYQCTQFQSNCFEFQRILTTNYEKYRTLSKMEEIKFIITIREEGLILKKEFLKTINLFFKNFKKIQLAIFESISIMITNSTIQPQIIQSQIKDLSKMNSYSEFGLNEKEKLLIANLLEITLRNKRIFVFPKIDLTQRKVGINPELKMMLEIDNRSKYWVNNDPAKHLYCKTLQDIVKLGPKEDIFDDNIKLFLVGTNERFKKNMQLLSLFQEIVQDIKLKNNSSKSRFLYTLRGKKQYYNFDKRFQHQRKQKINQLINHNLKMSPSLPFWINCLSVLKHVEQVISNLQNVPLKQIQQVLVTSEKEIMQLIFMISKLVPKENQLSNKFLYVFHRIFKDSQIFYRLTRGKNRTQSQFSFHVQIKQVLASSMTQYYDKTRNKLLSNYEIQPSISLQQCEAIKSLYQQALKELDNKESHIDVINQYRESILKLEQIRQKNNQN